MATKTVIATGASSGLGFEAARQVLMDGASAPHRLIVAARDPARAQAAYDALAYDRARHAVTVLPAELSDLRSVRAFARQALAALGGDARLDCLFLNAGMSKPADGAPGPHGSRWCETFLVNHLSQHYLVHLLRDALVASQARIVVVSSGAVRGGDPAKIDKDMRADGGADIRDVYTGSKFVQLLGAHWWRRELQGACTVVAVSPGLIPDTGIFVHVDPSMRPTSASPDAKTVEEGAQSLLRAFTANDLPEDPEQIFLTSWGEWWPKSVYEASLDKDLQKKWCPSLEEIEREEGL